MQYKFNIVNDNLICDAHDTPFTGNVNTYRCVFDIKCNIENLSWFCVFERKGKAYVQAIVDGECFIPSEVLLSEGAIKIGCYATNLNEDDYRRISTNWVYFKSLEGAYTDASVPEIPEPDVWEELVLKCVPIIGKNGNWYIFDIKQGKYVDSGVSASGSGGGNDGADTYTFDVSISKEGVVTTDTTYEEIESAYNEGKLIICMVEYASNTLIVPLSIYDNIRFIFKMFYDNAHMDLECVALDPGYAWNVYKTDIVTQEEFDKAIGDIETALDNIIAIQNEVIGGEF